MQQHDRPGAAFVAVIALQKNVRDLQAAGAAGAAKLSES
jgi:hypothetical protein